MDRAAKSCLSVEKAIFYIDTLEFQTHNTARPNDILPDSGTFQDRLHETGKGALKMIKQRYFMFFFNIILLGSLLSCATIPKANLALGQLQLGKPEKAWQMISAEWKHPTVSSQEDMCELNLATLQILANIIGHDFAPSNPDAIAEKSYNYVISNCQAHQNKVQGIENQYGLYFLNTRRPGAALPYFTRALTLSRKGSFDHMANEHNIGLCYSDMGQYELRDLHRTAAIKIGRAYFETPRTYKFSMDEFNEWNGYLNLLLLRLDELAWGENKTNHLPEMHELWNEIEMIAKKWYTKPTRYIAYHRALQRFAQAGDTVFARKLLSTAKQLVEKNPYPNKEVPLLDLKSAEANILSAEGNTRRAADLYQNWIAMFPGIARKKASGNDYRLVALAQEADQRYGLAIENFKKCIAEYEKSRSSFEVSSRGTVLSGLMLTPYWGLMRSHAARYMDKHQESDFQGAIKAARLLRARQFSELLGLEYRIEDKLDISLLKLKPDELLLNVVVTDRAIIIFAITPEWHELYVVPYEKNQFNKIARRIKSGLANTGDQKELIQDLRVISRMIIAPIKNRLKKINRLIVIPDGLLNGIPFTLLSKTSDDYHPIIYDHEVLLTPSISYFLKLRNTQYLSTTDNVFAMADPDFGTREVPEEFKEHSLTDYKRAVEDLNLFEPLHETRLEVENILRLFPADNVTCLFGNKATETNFKSLDLTTYDYLHFATHGILGNQIPGVYEPALVLATEPAKSGQDGFLTLSEVEQLKLNSKLAVLSACDTGTGKYFTGEGVMSLSRGFLLAGSRSVIVSLWPVASDETVQLMNHFYRYLRLGKSAATSLRLAQLAILGQTEKQYHDPEKDMLDPSRSQTLPVHPFYWAPFILVGE